MASIVSAPTNVPLTNLSNDLISPLAMKKANVSQPDSKTKNGNENENQTENQTETKTETSRRRSRSDSDDSKALTVLANGTVLKVQKSRQRQVYSCVACHKKKIRCSREHPICTNCRKVNVECKYFANRRVSRGGRHQLQERQVILPQDLSRNVIQPNDIKQPIAILGFYSPPLFANEPFTEAKRQNENIAISENDAPAEMSASDSVLLASLTTMDSAQHDGSMTDITACSTSLLSPEGYSRLTELTENGFISETSNTFQKPGPGISSFINTNIDFPALSNVRHIPSADTVGKISIKNIDTHISSNPVYKAEDIFSFNPVPVCFTPISDANPATVAKSSCTTWTGGFDFDFGKKMGHSNFSPESQLLGGYSIPKFDTQASKPQGLHYDKRVSGLNSLKSSEINDPTASILVNATRNPAIPKVASSMVSAQTNALNPQESNPATTINFLYGTNINYHSPDILRTLMNYIPSKKRSYELIERYFQSVHVLLPIMINIEEFFSEHKRFWFQIEQHLSGTSKVSESYFGESDLLQFFTLYFPVIYASTISEFEEYDNLLLNQEIDKYLKAFNNICQYQNYPHGLKSISLLLGNVIIQSTSPNPSTMELSQIIRYAKFLQLHKDPVKTLRIQDRKVIEFRRTLWWVIFGLDAVSSHNFCLPPVCRFNDFNVEMPEPYDPVFDMYGNITGRTLNVSVLAMGIKFKFDRIVSDLVYSLYNGLSSNITIQEMEDIKSQISALFFHIHESVSKLETHYKQKPPGTVNEMNLFDFVKHQSWSFADRATSLLHRKILLTNRESPNSEVPSTETAFSSRPTGPLCLSEYENTYGHNQEANIIQNFDVSSIAQLRFNQNQSFSYEDLQSNLIPSILHNLNDFLKYNDFIKFGKFNWYVKRTIPLDSIILLLVIMCVKLKYDFMSANELILFVKLINKTLFILNRKYFKNEKYKRMLSLTNTTWEFILKKYSVLQRVSTPEEYSSGCGTEFLDHQVAGFSNMNELFALMDVPQPAMVMNGHKIMPPRDHKSVSFNHGPVLWPSQNIMAHRSKDEKSQLLGESETADVKTTFSEETKEIKNAELLQLSQKIYYDLRNNFVDINDYCTFYSSLENTLHALMDYINGCGESSENIVLTY